MGEYLLASGDFEQDITRLGIRVVVVSAIALLILVFIAGITRNKYDHLRMPLFLMIAFTIIVSTGTLFGSTIYLNTKSDSGGPVHWHADFEAWACGVQLELRDPSGFLSNKIGTPTLHEHDDQRIHLEGVVVDKDEDATLGKFMRVVGGSISNVAMTIPLTEGILEDHVDGDKVDPRGTEVLGGLLKTDELGGRYFQATTNDTCDGHPAEPQTFVYQFDEASKTYSQKKLADPSGYTIRDDSIVPPGDCIIMEFEASKDRTDRLCEQYGVSDKNRCESFGVQPFNPKKCEIEEALGGNQ